MGIFIGYIITHLLHYRAFYYIIRQLLHYQANTAVVIALGDHRRERPPAVYGHVINVPTHSNVKQTAISGHLPNTDAVSYLWVVRTCYDGQCTQMPRFRRSFQPKIAGSHPNLRSTVRSIFSQLPSGDHKQYFISRVVYACVMNHVISASQR